VATSHPNDRGSGFSTPAWISPNRPCRVLAPVPPGGVATFSWQMSPQTWVKPGIYQEHFSLVVDGLEWMNDPGISYQIDVRS
jgi:hypothetical protein